MNYNVIASGSDGNAVIYFDKILVDCGIPYNKIEKYKYKIQLILLTHSHKDHFNVQTIKKLCFERPGILIGCCDYMIPEIIKLNIRNIITGYEIGRTYKYPEFKICPVKLYHDVPNCGYRILTDNYKIFHATDTAHLNGITAKNYNLYAIEHSYDEDEIEQTIKEKEESGIFSYEKGARNSHLSIQQAINFIITNAGDNYEILRLHEHKN